MKIFTTFIFLCLFTFSSCPGSNNKSNEQTKTKEDLIVESIVENNAKTPTIDTNKKYPFKEIILNDLADITYIPIETNDHVLINNGINALSHFSDKYIIIVNYKSYDCYIFDRNGKIINFFNHKGQGPNEYLNIIGITADEVKKEIYIVDHPQKHRILVYSFDGDFIRTLSLPSNTTIGTIHNFDKETLLCEDNNHKNGNKKPYFLLSKQNGRIINELNITFNKERISPRFYQKTGEKGVMAVSYGYTPIIRFNEDFIIGDISQDTIYQYSKNKTLTPILVKTPSIYSQDPQMMVIPEFKTPKLFFLERTERKFNFETKEGFEREKIVYDYQSGLFYKYALKNKDYPNQIFYLNSGGYAYRTGKNILCQFISAEELIEANDEGELHGTLKDITKTLRIDDNPVLMIMKFRE